MRAVPEFGHALLKELGAPKSLIQTFAEVRFRTADGKTVIPDGAIVCERGRRSWTCLVEVKTGSAQLRDDQVSSYLDVARDNGFDAVLTISNQITSSSAESPVSVDGRKLKKVALWHFSWWRVITDAIVQSRYRGVSDPDQAWILDELIAYLDHEASGAGGFTDMGEHWVSVRKAAHDGLRTRQTLARVGISAPSEMNAKPRVNWLLRQLKEAPADLRVDVVYPNARQTTAGLLSVVAEEPERLLYEQDPRRAPRSFYLTLSRRMGQKRGKEEGSFVRETRKQIVDFYGDLVQNLKPWQARAPRLREVELDEPAEVAQPDPPAAVDPATRDPGTAVEPAVS